MGSGNAAYQRRMHSRETNGEQKIER